MRCAVWLKTKKRANPSSAAGIAAVAADVIRMRADIKPGDQVGIVCCSNAWKKGEESRLCQLEEVLSGIGLVPVRSPYIFERESVEGASAMERAQALMDFYRDDAVKVIFDISGGDISNGILPYLDYGTIAACRKKFWGYSDLTTVINAIYTKTGKDSVLYQICNLLYEHGVARQESFKKLLFGEGDELLQFPCRFLQGKEMDGIVVGGNVRCFLKLAGTAYCPNFADKILLLESLGGTVPQMLTYFCQLQQLGAFEQIRGILLGTFTQMEREKCVPDVWTLLQRFVNPALPVAQTAFVGHGTDSQAVLVGSYRRFAITV